MAELSRTSPPWGRIALAWLAVVTLVVIAGWDRLLEWRFPDPDDTLRMVQVRDLLAGQAWFDLHQYRISPGQSPVMHWSRIVDAPLLLLMTALTPLVGPDLAESVTVFLMPLLTLGATMAVVGWMAHRLFGAKIAGFACLACGLSPMLLSQLQPLRVDHHGWQALAVVAAASALLHHKPQWSGAIAGLSLSAGLLISIELLPLAAAFGAVMLLRWLRDPEQRVLLPAYLLSLCVGMICLFGLTRGFGDLTPYCDAISPAHLLCFAVVSCASLGLAAWRGLSNLAIVALLGCAGVAGLALFLWQAPECLGGPFGTLDPLVREYWYSNVREGRPVWVQPLGNSLPVVVQALVALSAVIHLWRRSEAERQSWWLSYAILLGAAILGGLLVWRSMAFVGALAALPNGWLIYRLIERFRAGNTPATRIGTVLVAIFALAPTSPAALANLPKTETARTADVSSCDLRESVALLNDLEPALFFTPIDIGPAFLERTHHSVVATGHHRGQGTMRDVISAYLSADELAYSTIIRHGARYVAVCTKLEEPQLYASHAPNGLMSHLLQGKVPHWLEEVPLGAPRTFKVWRVVD